MTYSRQLLRVFTRKELIVSVEAQLGLQVKENALLACAEQDWTPWADRSRAFRLLGELCRFGIG